LDEGLCNHEPYLHLAVEVESERKDLLDSQKRACLAAPEVQQCYYVTGSVDFVLVITVTSMKEYEALSQRLFMQNPNVKKFVTMVALDPFKLGLELPVE
jgi:DNA-binding Lrp family transcriptional regulator